MAKQMQWQAMYLKWRLYCMKWQHLKTKHIWGDCGILYIAVVERLNVWLGLNRHNHRQAVFQWPQHNYSPCEECSTRVVLMVGIRPQNSWRKAQELRMQPDPSPGRREACNMLSEGRRFRHSRQSRPEHPGVSDSNLGRCWWSTAIPLYISLP